MSDLGSKGVPLSQYSMQQIQGSVNRGSHYYSSFKTLILQGLGAELEPIPVLIGWKAGNNLDRLPVNHRADTHNHTHTLTPVQCLQLA